MTGRNGMRSGAVAAVCAAALWALLSLTAEAVIKIEFPVSRIYKESKTVRSATVVAVDASRGVVAVKPGETFKGVPARASLLLTLTAPAGVIGRVATGQPVALFLADTEGQGVAIVHVADSWLLGQCVADAKPPALNIVQGYDGARAFPGRTAALVRLLAAMKVGRSPMEDKLDPACLAGKSREVANLGVKATFLETADVNGDTHTDLLVGTSAGVRLFLGSANGYANVTDAWGLRDLKAEHAAAGDVSGDRLPDLLLGPNLFVRKGDGFARAEPAPDLPPEAEWLDAALADVTGDQAADIVVLLRTGELVELRNPREAGKPWPRASRKLWEDGGAAAARFSTHWGESSQLGVMVVRGDGVTRHVLAGDGEPATPFMRLTGTPWPPKLAAGSPSPAAVKRVVLDCDGNGKPDFLLFAPGGGVALLNRGFGAFYVDYSIPLALKPEDPKAQPFSIGAGTFLAGGQLQRGELPRQNLLVLTEDGRLYEVPNTPPIDR